MRQSRESLMARLLPSLDHYRLRSSAIAARRPTCLLRCAANLKRRPGQERAVEAISLAMRMRRKGYSVYALGPSDTGRHSHIEALLRKQVESRADSARLVLR